MDDAFMLAGDKNRLLSAVFEVKSGLDAWEKLQKPVTVTFKLDVSLLGKKSAGVVVLLLRILESQ
ncbi:hypothetical protein [Paenibacillus eucommiae]|uniref:Uncharacterized protein n=1 Tax=Paenibacillus eucommiae TaxID=1355755 RepID=A0ABS4ISM6_9BACL|nr:hypothetical protein [Paenibacillus eucommiae]MBP1990523.1 hypothetical protein [Paenibacillus eucommiae]